MLFSVSISIFRVSDTRFDGLCRVMPIIWMGKRAMIGIDSADFWLVFDKRADGGFLGIGGLLE